MKKVRQYLSDTIVDTNIELLSLIQQIVNEKCFINAYIGHREFSDLDHHLFILVKFNIPSSAILAKLKINKDVVSIYPVGSWDDNKFMIVVQVPEEYKPAFKNFILGRYSEMYTKTQLYKLFGSKQKEIVFKVLTKDQQYRKELEVHLGLDEGTIPIDAELENKPKLEEIIYEYELLQTDQVNLPETQNAR